MIPSHILTIPTNILLVYVAALVAMMATTCMRSIQNKNVVGGHKTLAFICGGIMTLFEGFVIAMIAKQGSDVIYFTAIGSAIGWVVGMFIHDAIMRRKMKALKKAKKHKKRAKLDDLIQLRVEEILKEQGLL